MANNYLITGYWGEPHVTAENDRGIHAAIFGAGRFVLPVGEQFRAEYIGNNTIRMYDGKLLDNGAAAGIPAGEYIDLVISNAGQGMKRNDLIVFQYEKDATSMVETGKFVVVKGTETSGAAADPSSTQADLLSDKAAFDQMALWRVPVSGTTIAAPEQLFVVRDSIQTVAETASAAVSYAVQQNLTEEQKKQAQENIDAASTDFVFNCMQFLTEYGLGNCWISFTDEDGNPTDEPYIHWEQEV